MLRDIQVTLYDVFGYLLPGFVALVALASLFWAAVGATHPLSELSLSGAEWVAITVAAYLLGHVVQSLANFAAPAMGASDAEIAAAVLKKVPTNLRKELEQTLGADPESIFRLCDAGLLQKGNVADRDIFVYREGFYRGMVAAFFLAGVAVVVRWASGGASYVHRGEAQHVSASVFAFSLVVCCIAVVLSYARYRRFARYRVAAAIWGFLGIIVAGRLTQDIP